MNRILNGLLCLFSAVLIGIILYTLNFLFNVEQSHAVELKSIRHELRTVQFDVLALQEFDKVLEERIEANKPSVRFILPPFERQEKVDPVDVTDIRKDLQAFIEKVEQEIVVLRAEMFAVSATAEESNRQMKRSIDSEMLFNIEFLSKKIEDVKSKTTEQYKLVEASATKTSEELNALRKEIESTSYNRSTVIELQANGIKSIGE